VRLDKPKLGACFSIIYLPKVTITAMKCLGVVRIAEADRFNNRFEGQRIKPNFALDRFPEMRLVSRDGLPHMEIQSGPNDLEHICP
jgi:hypothetical protein